MSSWQEQISDPTGLGVDHGEGENATARPEDRGPTDETARVQVGYAWCVAIRVRYLGPTNYRGSRWRVWRADDTYAADPDAMELGYNHALNASDNAAAMVRAYLKKKADNDGWNGRWVVAGHGDSEYVAVKAGALETGMVTR